MSAVLRIQAVCQAAPTPDRINEDACWQSFDGQHAIFAVIDGASQRLKVPGMMRLYPAAAQPSSVASQGAQLTRDTMRRSIQRDPFALLLEANAAVRAAVEAIYGGITAEHILAVDGDFPILRDDPRAVRLALPACVCTVAHLDLAAGRLDYAHLGDTALFACYTDGRVEEVTADPIGRYDSAALRHARDVQQKYGLAHFSEAIDNQIAEQTVYQEARQVNFNSGIYHNFVTPEGQVDRAVGVGVIDGLPEMEAYIQRGSLSLEGLQAVLLCSDGFPLPHPLGESFEARGERFLRMRGLIETEGVAGYLRVLRGMEREDAGRDAYPRFKLHDDATAIYVELIG